MIAKLPTGLTFFAPSVQVPVFCQASPLGSPGKIGHLDRWKERAKATKQNHGSLVGNQKRASLAKLANFVGFLSGKESDHPDPFRRLLANFLIAIAKVD